MNQAEHHDVYGAEKVWTQLGREGIYVARCTVAGPSAASFDGSSGFENDGG
jgi:hypothetical protein